ncbi:MAG: tRNA guanosine(34) transglycosylase Tgt [candidate division WOR-3 bacterium]|nr:tRNA guanosine(34) transglycosylase Tgt [candidate division WOR-3 bacterium]
MALKFNVIKEDSETFARYSIMQTKTSIVELPNFMPVVTTGTIKSLTTLDLKEMQTQIIVCNTYHLHLRPGEEVISSLGGLHKFINFHNSILTDSGGFQAFSLSKLRKVSEEGFIFKSHLDGSIVELNPKKVIDIQVKLNSDIMMVLDYPTNYPSTYEENLISVKLTTSWAKISKKYYDELKPKSSIFAIIQGGFYRDLRERSFLELLDLNFDGYAVGGLALGEPREERDWVVREFGPKLPKDKPRYVMGIGKPEEILEYISYGIDLFDCVIPTRNARRGSVFTSEGIIRLENAKYKYDERPIDLNCECKVCKNYSRAYIRHLFSIGEVSAGILASYHSVYFFIKFFEKIRKAILGGYFNEFKKDFLDNYRKYTL